MQATFRPLLIALAVILIPASSEADHPRVTAPPFTPAWASPQLHAETLGHGIIRIFGAKFHDDVQAFYGDIPMRLLEVGKRYIIAVLPPRARDGEFIYVIDNTGRARTAERFWHQRRYRRWRSVPPRY